MCGVTGFFDYRRRNASHTRGLLSAMTLSLAHRGPDGGGVFCEGKVGLGHRRLAIRDPSAAAAQPMFDAERELVLTYNGEIYNDAELRLELVDLGFRFLNESDSEIILNGYRAWGVEVLAKLNGIFAFALYDRRRESLLLARDPMGIKPLFIRDDGTSVTFASELKALLLDPTFGREIDQHALDSFFCFNYTPAPRSGLREARQLEPGTYRMFAADGSHQRRFWRLALDPELARLSEAEALELFDEQLTAAVRRQCVSDVPVAAFLSGGLDSAALAVAHERAGSPIEAFFHGRFRHAAYDESGTARAVAGHLGQPLIEFDVEEDLDDLPRKIAGHLEEPTADASAVPFYLLSRATAEKVKVVMSGDGADELLAGYETYRATRWTSGLGFALTPLHWASRMLAPRDTRYNWREKLSRLSAYGVEPFPRNHASWRRIFSPALRRRLYASDFWESQSQHDPIAPYVAALGDAPPLDDRVARALWMDLFFYLPNDMLIKVDRMSMAHGLEVRVPFLDLELVRRIVSLPSALKLRRGWTTKHLLRRWLEPALPAAVLRRPKAGFNMPLEVWLRGSWGDLLLDAVATVPDRSRALSRSSRGRGIAGRASLAAGRLSLRALRDSDVRPVAVQHSLQLASGRDHCFGLIGSDQWAGRR